MVFRKRMYGGATYPPLKRYKKDQGNAAKLKRLQRVVSALRPETKTFTTIGTLSSISTSAGVIGLISGVATGSTDSTRIGKRIRLTNLNFMLKVQATMGSSQADHLSVYVIRDKQCNGVLPTITGSADSIFSSSDPLTAVMVPSNRDRFKVVWQGHMDAPEQTNSTLKFSPYAKYKLNDVCTFQADTALIGSADQNAYFIVALCNDASLAGVCYYTAQFDFTDV